MYPESALLPISAMQHFRYCERQCALIHIEKLWEENVFTAQGRVMHRRTDEPRGQYQGDVRVESGLLLRSLRLGLSGKADVVEFHPSESGKSLPVPIEYKRGRPKPGDFDEIQLCAQAMCLEEMLDVDVPQGAIFYGKTRRRLDVLFDDALRRETEETAAGLHALIGNGRTPPAEYGKKCDACSLFDLCLPKHSGGKRSAVKYLKSVVREP